MKKLSITLSFALVISFLTSPSAALAADVPLERVRVYYAGPAGNVQEALQLGSQFDIVSDTAEAQVFVLNGNVPHIEDIVSYIRGGAGLVLILGPDMTADQVEKLIGTQVMLEQQNNPISLIEAKATYDSVQKDIIWNSSPQVRERYLLLSQSATLFPLVLGFEDGSLLLGMKNTRNGRAYILTPFLGGTNTQFQDWAYFKYLIYYLTVSAAGKAAQSFADYPYSPVPHKSDRTILAAGMAGMLVISFMAFSLVRRYSLAHPEVLDVLVADRKTYITREVSTQWEEIGFHRPLGGFLLILMLGLLLFIPLIIYQNLILPVYILPSAQALGIWGRVVQFFNLAWQFFDMGTSTAFIKFISEYRVHDPRKGIQYGQVFIWWQALSGAVQVALVVLLASTIGSRSAYALYAWSIIIHAFIQIPGFYQVYRHTLTGLQRFDYAQMLDMALNVILPMLVQPIFVTVMYAWGKSHPAFGASTGGLLGMGIAAYAAEALTFTLGWWLYRRLGYNAHLLFLAHFDWQVVKASFRFGVFEMLGSIAWAGGQAAEIWITQSRLINYAEVWGNWGLAQNFIFAYQALSNLFNNLMPSISEAISHGRKLLSQYYEVQAYKWGGIISAFMCAVLLAVADRFILGASGPQFTRAAAYSIPLIIWGAIQYPSWVGDNVQLAANRPYLKSILVTGEQVIRVILALILIKQFQINALIFAYFIGLLTKGILAYFINHRICFPHRFYAWQSLIAPILAGITHYMILRWVTGMIWHQDEISSILIFLVAILPSFPFYAFLYGLFGGWDDETLEELHQAVKLSNFMRPLAWVFWAATALGAHISPLHGRFPIDIRQGALKEASTLTIEKVPL